MAGDRKDGEPWPHEPKYSRNLRRAGVAACAVLYTIVILTVISAMARQPPASAAMSAVALAVGVTGTGWNIVSRSGRGTAAPATLTAAGVAGAALIALVPSAAGYLIVFTALLAVSMAQPLSRSFAAGLIIVAAAGVAALTATKTDVASLVSNGVGAAFLFSIGVFTRYARMSQARAEHLLAQLRAAQDAQAKAVILTERTRLAREVHDILAHSLSGLVLTLATAELLGRRGEASPENHAKILEQVARAQRIARDGLSDTRRAVAALRGDELPGPALLERLVRDTSQTAGIRACLTVSGTSRPLPPEVGLAVYRTAQEALVNSAKYAGRGATAELRLDYGAEWVTLEAEDRPAEHSSPDPVSPLPVSPLAAAEPVSGLTFGGYGLAGMRERAELLGGDLTAGPTDAGFRVTLRLPAHDRAITHAAV